MRFPVNGLTIFCYGQAEVGSKCRLECYYSTVNVSACNISINFAFSVIWRRVPIWRESRLLYIEITVLMIRLAEVLAFLTARVPPLP